ncbi:MAG: GTPase HflX [Phycisphaeraceae bacterium]|nr:GTPase HflX [Phycisphaerales bacterium]QOJ18852.1 MAG: GTPase HflX [Phycisphaeraceae bacterium]
MSQPMREQLQVAAERAVLVQVILTDPRHKGEEDLSELRSLAETAGAVVVGEMTQRRRKPAGRTYVGTGKVKELASFVKERGAELLIFDNDLAPSQIAAIEEETECKVIDRSELILDIFANRATTHAAKLQVEIAQLEYTYPRLRAMWSHLERIVGGAPVGIGTRGPGEQQLEIDRRIVQRRKAQLRRELAEIEARKTREVATRNMDHFTVGLVGYTNAGKSTLFNRLTSGGAYADNRLFSTLSTRVERWNLGGGMMAMVSDTVGFIRDLPHHLVASFRSTLEETRFARLLLIVLDVTDPRAEQQLETVSGTLDEIEATTQPRLLLLNKVDVLPDPAVLSGWLERDPHALPISAAKGIGLDRLREVVRDKMLGGLVEVSIEAPLSDSRTIDYLEKRTEVLDRAYDGTSVTLRTRVGRPQVSQLLAQGARLRINGLEPREAMAQLWGGAG